MWLRNLHQRFGRNLMLTKINLRCWLCLCPSARTLLRRRRIDSQGLKAKMGILVGLDSSAALKAAYRTPRQPTHRGGERVMDECEICGRVDRTVKWTTVHIDYNYGPIKHRICRDCAES